MNLFKEIKRAVIKKPAKKIDVDHVGEDDWNNIFLRCDYSTLCRLNETCKLFHTILTNPKFWILKCDYDGVSLPPVAWRKFVWETENNEQTSSTFIPRAFDYRKIYKKRPYDRNLVRSLRADDTMDKLYQISNMSFEGGGNGFSLEPTPIGAVPHPDVENCLVTSYGWCRRIYEIRLKDYGVEDWVMDKIRPKITVSEMTICRHDCAARYEICVQLLKENEFFDRNIILPRFVRAEKRWNQWIGGHEWETTAFEFTEYPAGIRSIVLFTQGKDEQYWEGWYGPKFGNTRVVLTFPKEVRYKAEEEFSDPKRKFIAEPTIRHHTLRNFPLYRRNK